MRADTDNGHRFVRALPMRTGVADFGIKHLRADAPRRASSFDINATWFSPSRSISRDDLQREGQAQQDKANAQRDAAQKEAEAESARGAAKANEAREKAEQ